MKKTLLTTFLTIAIAIISNIASAQTTLAAWNFPNNPDDSTLDAGIPANNGQFISTHGGAGSASFSTSGLSSNVASATDWDGGSGIKYWMIELNTANYYGVVLSSRQRSNATGPAKFKIEYKIGSGGSWTTAYSYTVANNWSTGNVNGLSLPTAVSNQPSVFIRWIMSSNQAVTAPGNTTAAGISMIDDIEIMGNLSTSYSDVVVNAGFSYTSNIDYRAYQDTDITLSNTSIPVASFMVRDGGSAATDNDGLPTILTAITYSITNRTNLRRIALYSDNLELGETAVTGNTVTFPGLNLSVLNNSEKAIELRVTYKATVTDNARNVFTITSVIADPSGSNFHAANGGGASSSTTGDRNKVEVSGTSLHFTNTPSTADVNQVMTPPPSVITVDNFGNLDLDFSGSVTLINSNNISCSNNTEAIVNGEAVFTFMEFQSVGITTLSTVNGSGLSNTGAPGTTTVSNGNALPVVLVNFSAINSLSGTDLSWTTASETDNAGFEIERSEDGTHFETLTMIAGNGSTQELHTYSYTDNEYRGNASVLYYRLKQIDFNGKSEYSKTIKVKLNNSLEKLSVSIQDNEARLLVPQAENGNGIIMITDLQGKLVYQNTVALTDGNNSLNLNLPDMPTGTYCLSLISSGKAQTMKFVKN